MPVGKYYDQAIGPDPNQLCKTPAKTNTLKKSPPKGFVMITRRFIEDTRISGKAKAIGLVFAARAKRDRTVELSTEDICEATGFGITVVERERPKLVDAGYIEFPPARKAGRWDGVRGKVTPELLEPSRKR